MITIFEYETPMTLAIKDAVVQYVDNYEDDEGNFPFAGTSDKILFVDHELAENDIMTVSAKYEGVVMCYASASSYQDESNTQTADQKGSNTITVTILGFGDVSEKDTFDGESGLKRATKRAQELSILAYKAIMDRVRIQDNFDAYREEPISTDKYICEKTVLSASKGDLIGVLDSNRAVASYIYNFNIKVVDIPPVEASENVYLGVDETVSTTDT